MNPMDEQLAAELAAKQYDAEPADIDENTWGFLDHAAAVLAYHAETGDWPEWEPILGD